MMEGIRFVLSQQVLLVLMSLVAVTSFLSRPYQTLLPVFADRDAQRECPTSRSFLVLWRTPYFDLPETGSLAPRIASFRRRDRSSYRGIPGCFPP